MENKNEKTVELLNSLIEINTDRIDGYEKAAKEVKSKELESLFTGLADESRKNRSELISEVVSNGGRPKEGTTLSGKYFRAWMDVKAALTNHNMMEIVRSCEFGEDAALEVYDEVLNDSGLAIHSRDLVNKQRTIIKKSHDHIKVLRDGVKEPHHL